MITRNNPVSLLVLLLAATGPLYAQEARQWLDEMSGALQTLDYDGTFVYLHDGKLEAMRIIHQVDDEGEKERLISLTGSAREVVRDNETVTCIMSDSKSVMVGQSRPRQPFPVVPRDVDSLFAYYRIEALGADRIAGNMAQVIAITPRDAYRYGYRFWIDKDSKMLLKSDLNDANGRPIEQVMFTRMAIESAIPAVALAPTLSGDSYAWYRQSGDDPAVAETGTPHWVVTRIPAGFNLKHYLRKRIRPDGDAAEHMVYSDGLATVSVYVEKIAAGEETLSGLSSMGAVNAFGSVVNGHQVVVVGEVPAETVEMMARSIESRESPRE